MTSPNNAPGHPDPHPSPDPGDASSAQETAADVPRHEDAGGTHPEAWGQGAHAASVADPARGRRAACAELRIGALTVLGGAVLGLLVGALWVWLAPKVPLYADSQAVYLKQPEGEQAAAADGWFALLGAAAGLVTALAGFLLTRARGGGVGVAVGLALGGIAGALIAWRLGTALGPSGDMVAAARRAGTGSVFYGPLRLGAKSALLVWPMTAMVVLLVLSAVLGKHEWQPLPYWYGASGERPADSAPDGPGGA